MLVIEHDGSDEEILADENWELPCSVRTLRISNLKTLNSQILKSLTSLESLHIEFNKGEYWPKIAHISTIYIDGEYL
ncbi:hypothetical protein P3S67_014275 [Capsicum chacoense]